MKPLKRIGEEVQFKKFKGNYLFYFFGIILSLLIILIILLSLEIPTIFKIVIIIILGILTLQLLKSFQKKSMDDYYIDIRKRCYKSNFQIKAEIIKSLPHD
ncbi:DUF4133 domain-containing protein [Tenacibaculum finnmarkense]|uniref:DUF4133 domain-containing protein n=1 Tax=Tenacibaculum finnmarkense TaxID=2781243 RepID=UPI001E5F5ABB|nr:DUF4133 domain-containing protein [Tenacibaculum finnmarkense]MCD8401363.1 DUF4133 domain-containing protein [Tenacibaculum finnmarkense genomovar ulcerans]